MNAKLRRGRITPDRIQTMLRKHLYRAMESLDEQALTDARIHAARKHLGKARSMLRLLRPALGRQYKRENAVLRDAARPLGALRDGRVLIDTLDKLSMPMRGRVHALRRFRRTLIRERAVARERFSKSRPGFDSRRAALKRLYARIPRWGIEENGNPLGKAFKRTYVDGREALLEVFVDGGSARLHVYRKRTKCLWHQLQTLGFSGAHPIGKMAQRAHELADLLGDDHDLSLLAEHAAKHRKSFGDDEAYGAVLASIDRRRLRLRVKITLLGARVYGEEPAAWMARVQGRFEAEAVMHREVQSL